jgi:hypothetical protein
MRPTPPHRTAAGRAALGLAFGTALGTALLAAPAAAAHAQFGKLARRAASAATEAAAGRAAKAAAEKAGVAAKAGVSAGDAGSAGGADQLEITPERLDAFLVGMRGPAAAAQRGAAYEARRAAWEKAHGEHEDRKTKYDECLGDVANRGEPDTSPAAVARYARLEKALDALSDRAAKAGADGDPASGARLADSVGVLQRAMTSVQYPSLVRRCGQPPSTTSPQPPADDTPARDGPAFRPAVPAGMTPRQFGMLRERVAAWLIAADRRYAYSPAEQRALESRRAALAPLTPLFRGNDLPWGSMMHGLGGDS